jgi:hypothetical protein
MSQIEKTLDRLSPSRVSFQAPTVEQLRSLRERSPINLVLFGTDLKPKAPRYLFLVHGEASDAFLPRYLGLINRFTAASKENGYPAPTLMWRALQNIILTNYARSRERNLIISALLWWYGRLEKAQQLKSNVRGGSTSLTEPPFQGIVNYRGPRSVLLLSQLNSLTTANEVQCHLRNPGSAPTER